MSVWLALSAHQGFVVTQKPFEKLLGLKGKRDGVLNTDQPWLTIVLSIWIVLGTISVFVWTTSIYLFLYVDISISLA